MRPNKKRKQKKKTPMILRYSTGRNEKNFVIDNPELLVGIGVHVVSGFTDGNTSLVELSVAFLGSFPVILVVDAIGDENLNNNDKKPKRFERTLQKKMIMRSVYLEINAL